MPDITGMIETKGGAKIIILPPEERKKAVTGQLVIIGTEPGRDGLVHLIRFAVTSATGTGRPRKVNRGETIECSLHNDRTLVASVHFKEARNSYGKHIAVLIISGDWLTDRHVHAHQQ